MGEALAAVSDLATPGDARDQLWLVLWDRITTRGSVEVVPSNSTARVRVTSDLASVELIAAWEWLAAHEPEARAMDAGRLEWTLRGVATRSHHGSARAAMADALCGISHVPGDVHLWVDDYDALSLEAS